MEGFIEDQLLALLKDIRHTALGLDSLEERAAWHIRENQTLTQSVWNQRRRMARLDNVLHQHIKTGQDHGKREWQERY